MHKYIEKMFNELIPDNKGYRYIRTEQIFVPFYNVTLSVTRRKQNKLNLIEEMVLKIVECGVNEIDEITGVLGINRNIVDLTIGDLHVKGLAYHYSNKCVLNESGRNVLRELSFSRKEKYSLKNVYVNAVNSEILEEKDKHMVNSCNGKDHKVQHNLEGDNVEFYRNKIGEIKDIFNKESENFVPDGSQVPYELISIDNVEDINVCFIKIPVHIYLSESGLDIDLITTNKSLCPLLDSIKSDVIDQIKKKKLLKNIFSKFSVPTIENPYKDFDNAHEIKDLLKKYTLRKSDKEHNLSAISKKVHSNRMLIENELEKLFELNLKDVNKVDFYLNNLDYWSKNIKFISLLSMISSNKKFNIYYNSVGNIALSMKRIKNSIPEATKEKIIEFSHDEWIKIAFGDKYELTGYPENYNAINNDTWITKVIYYLKMINKSK